MPAVIHVVCVRQGTKYGAEYVRKLWAMVARNLGRETEGKFVCFTDQPDELPAQIEVLPIPEGVEGWWAKLWLFSPELFPEGDRVVYFDLDTVIVGDLDDIFAYDGEFAILRDFFRPDGLQSSVMAWPAGIYPGIWKLWDKWGRPEKDGGDQAWIEEFFTAFHIAPDIWQDRYPGKFCSYKFHCKPFPNEGTSVVVFHGEPRPHNCGQAWVEAMWSEADTGHFQLPMTGNTPLDQIREQSKASAARGLKRLKSLPAREQAVVIVGGGPSLNDPITFVELNQRIAEGCAIWALNGTYRWLLDKGVTPDALVVLDARPDNARFVRNVSPESTVYLASQCHPHVYAALLPSQIVRFDLEVMGDCGTTVGTHAIAVAFTEGFRTIHLYGFDSSYRDGEGHAYQQDLNAAERIVDAHVGAKTFKAAPWMVRQAQDFEGLAQVIVAAGGEIIVHGDGLLPEIAKQLSQPQCAADIRAFEILKRLGGVQFPTGAEIGVFRGDLSCRLLSRNDLTLLMVDSWEGEGKAYAEAGDDFHAALTDEEQAACLEQTQAVTHFAGPRAKIVRRRSVEAAEGVEDASLDFCFIDADHSYAGCKADIAAWFPKVKPGGFISGHDYANTEYEVFGVTRAVDEFAASVGRPVDLGDNFTWFLRKDDQ